MLDNCLLLMVRGAFQRVGFCAQIAPPLSRPCPLRSVGSFRVTCAPSADRLHLFRNTRYAVTCTGHDTRIIAVARVAGSGSYTGYPSRTVHCARPVRRGPGDNVGGEYVCVCVCCWYLFTMGFYHGVKKKLVSSRLLRFAPRVPSPPYARAPPTVYPLFHV